MAIDLLALQQEFSKVAKISSETGGDIRFDVKASFGGYADSISPTLLPNFLSESSINNIGFGTYLEKVIGSERFGIHTDVDEKELVGIRCGYFTNNFGQLSLFKIVKDNNNKNKIYFLVDKDGDFKFKNEELTWIDQTPSEGIGTGIEYNWAVWRNTLFIVSGEEYSIGAQRGGVLAYDPFITSNIWRVIDTGFGVSSSSASSGADGPSKFFPSLIHFYNDTMYLSGSKAHRLQVKFAEHSNPDNVVGSSTRPFLGLLDVPPVIADLLRPSTFVLNQNGDRVTALFSANDFLWVATNKRFYAYKTISVLNASLPAGLLYLDTLQEHKARSGVFNQRSIIQNDEVYDFVTTNFSKPAVATMVPVISKERIDKLVVSRSQYIQKTMQDIDWSNAAMGSYGFGNAEAIVFISGSKCGAGNDTTLAYKVFQDTPMFTKIPYIKANDWMDDGNFTYYLSSDSGILYQLTPTRFTNDTPYPFVYQSGRIGVAANDQDFSQKKLIYIYLVACSDKDVEIEFNIFNQTSSNNSQCCTTFASYKYKPDIDCTDLENCSCKDDAATPFVHQRGVIFTRLIAVEAAANITYNTLDIRLIARTEGYFAIHQIGVVYERLASIDGEIIDKLEVDDQESIN